MMRESTEATLERAGGWVARILCGAILLTVGCVSGWFAYHETPVHTTHLLLSAGFITFGVLVPFGQFIWPTFDQLWPRAEKVVVNIFNRRAGDPQSTTVVVTPPTDPPKPPASP